MAVDRIAQREHIPPASTKADLPHLYGAAYSLWPASVTRCSFSGVRGIIGTYFWPYRPASRFSVTLHNSDAVFWLLLSVFSFKKLLTFRPCCGIIIKSSGRDPMTHLGVAQLVARYLGVVEAASSSLVTQTKGLLKSHKKTNQIVRFWFVFCLFCHFLSTSTIWCILGS